MIFPKSGLRRPALAMLLASALPAVASAATSSVTGGFEGLSRTDATAFFPGFPHGAIGPTQFAEFAAGSFAVFDRSSGARLASMSDNQFWQAAGATRFFNSTYTDGNTRIRFNADANRWIATSFTGRSPDRGVDYDITSLNIGVSQTADATGPWAATTFKVFNPASTAAAADFPTLAFDRNAVYVATDNFDPLLLGTTLNVIPIGDVFGAGAPNVANRAIFFTPAAQDAGFSIQGVNSQTPGVGRVVAESLSGGGRAVGYDIANPGGGGGGASRGAIIGITGGPVEAFNLDARQPDGTRTLDTLDSRIGTSVWEQDGKIYFTRTVTPDGSSYTATRVTVLDAATYAVLQEIDIDAGDYDYYQSSLAVSEFGVVVSYNRSGRDPATGTITLLANAYTFDADGLLVFDAEHLLRASPTSYHIFGDRWGLYSATTVDPTDPHKFWAVGSYAGAADRWATWVGEVSFADATVPEPGSWAMMIAGFGLVGSALRQRRRAGITVA